LNQRWANGIQKADIDYSYSLENYKKKNVNIVIWYSPIFKEQIYNIGRKYSSLNYIYISTIFTNIGIARFLRIPNYVELKKAKIKINK